MSGENNPSDFLINFHKQHFTDDIPIYSKEVFYKLLEEMDKNFRKEEIWDKVQDS